MGIVRDSKGNPVRDSSGNAVRTGTSRGNSPAQRNNAQPLDPRVASAVNAGANQFLQTASGRIKNPFLKSLFNLGAAAMKSEMRKSTSLNTLTNRQNQISTQRQNSYGLSTNVAKSSYAGNSRSTTDDWRVKIKLPNISSFQTSPQLNPLVVKTDGYMVFPTLPQILVTHGANYDVMSPTHTNYGYQIYQNSQVEDLTIACEWPVENEQDGLYWIAATHFLRSVSKMFYGSDAQSNLGAPPPVVELSGYGDFVFPHVPIVIKMFSLDLNDGVDYIKVPLYNRSQFDGTAETYGASQGYDYSYVPVLSRLSIVAGIALSRNEVSQFNLDSYVQGDYIQGNGRFI